MADKGWISLHRQIQDCWIWTDDEKFDKAHAWIDLLLLANHRDKKIAVDKKPKIITRGQFLTSKKKLALRWNWNIKTVRKFLNILENDGMIVTESTSRWTTITILNYEVYQEVMDNSKDKTMDNSMDGYRDSYGDTSMDTNNNDNNENNINNNIIRDKKRTVFIPPTVEEVEAYCFERNNNVDPQHFIDYYSSNGWKVGRNKMKDWKSAVRTWERNNFSNNKGVKPVERANGYDAADIDLPSEEDLRAYYAED